MQDEIAELLDIAIYKEIASEAVYVAAKSSTDDPGAEALMDELALEEKKHIQWLTDFRDKGAKQQWHRGPVQDLKISEYLTAADSPSGAGLQDALIFAMKREQQSVDFYSRMMGIVRGRSAKGLCRKLVNEELRHKLKLELLYDGLFLAED